MIATTLAAASTTAVRGQEIGAASMGAKKRIVVAGGHPGDPEYGCGGTIVRLTEGGHDVTLLYLNRGDPNETPSQTNFPRVTEATRACEILKAVPMFAGQIDGRAVVDQRHYSEFRELIARQKPDALFTHWPIDNHADHRATSLLCYDAWVHSKKSFSLVYYEVSNGEDTTCFFPTLYMDITATADRKRQACFAHASQSPDRYYGLQQAVAKFRGLESGYAEAEAFVHHPQSPSLGLLGF